MDKFVNGFSGGKLMFLSVNNEKNELLDLHNVLQTLHDFLPYKHDFSHNPLCV